MRLQPVGDSRVLGPDSCPMSVMSIRFLEKTEPSDYVTKLSNQLHVSPGHKGLLGPTYKRVIGFGPVLLVLEGL